MSKDYDSAIECESCFVTARNVELGTPNGEQRRRWAGVLTPLPGTAFPQEPPSLPSLTSVQILLFARSHRYAAPTRLRETTREGEGVAGAAYLCKSCSLQLHPRGSSALHPGLAVLTGRRIRDRIGTAQKAAEGFCTKGNKGNKRGTFGKAVEQSLFPNAASQIFSSYCHLFTKALQ
jgi:hypothetical protein